MTGEYRRVHTGRLWSDGRMRMLRRQNRDAHEVLVYLLTGPASNFIGFYALPLAWAAHDMCWTAHRVQRAIQVLEEQGYAAYDGVADVVYLSVALDMDPICTDAQARGAVRRIESLPQTPLLARFRQDILQRLPSVRKPEALRPLLEFLGIVPEKDSNTRGLTAGQTPSLTSHETSPPAATPSPSPSQAQAQALSTTGSRLDDDMPDSVSPLFQLGNGRPDGTPTVPLTEAEEAFNEIVFPTTHEWHTRDLWLKALRLPGAIEAVEKAAAMLNGANAHDEIRKPGAFLWKKFQEILDGSGQQ